VRPRAREFALALVIGVVCAQPVRARIRFPSVADQVVGVPRDGIPAWRDGAARSRVEVGDMALFGIAGLRLTGVRTAARIGAFAVRVGVAQIASPVGSQARVSVEGGYAGRSGWYVGLRAGTERVALDSSPVANAVITGAVSSVDVGPVTTRADVESKGVGDGRFVSMNLSVAARVSRAAVIIATAHVDPPGAMGVGVAAFAPIHPALALLAGYDDASETLRGGLEFQTRRWEFSLGLFQHAVLGLSQGVSLAWLW
jgi:hypothetical protein